DRLDAPDVLVRLILRLVPAKTAFQERRIIGWRMPCGHMVEIDDRDAFEAKAAIDLGIHSLIPLHVIKLDELRKGSRAVAISDGCHNPGYAVARSTPICQESDHNNLVAVGEDVPEVRVSQLLDSCLAGIDLLCSPCRLSETGQDRELSLPLML